MSAIVRQPANTNTNATPNLPLWITCTPSALHCMWVRMEIKWMKCENNGENDNNEKIVGNREHAVLVIPCHGNFNIRAYVSVCGWTWMTYHTKHHAACRRTHTHKMWKLIFWCLDLHSLSTDVTTQKHSNNVVIVTHQQFTRTYELYEEQRTNQIDSLRGCGRFSFSHKFHGILLSIVFPTNFRCANFGRMHCIGSHIRFAYLPFSSRKTFPISAAFSLSHTIQFETLIFSVLHTHTHTLGLAPRWKLFECND